MNQPAAKPSAYMIPLLDYIGAAVALAEVPQEALAALKDLTEFASRLDEGLKEAKDTLKARQRAGTLACESGALGLQLTEAERRQPAWQTVAVDQARADAAAHGRTFSEAAFIAAVKARTDPVKVVSLKVVETA